VRNILAVMEEDGAALELFFQPSLSFALHLLDANHRDEAGRLEPLERGENAAALGRIPLHSLGPLSLLRHRGTRFGHRPDWFRALGRGQSCASNWPPAAGARARLP